MQDEQSEANRAGRHKKAKERPNRYRKHEAGRPNRNRKQEAGRPNRNKKREKAHL